MKPSAEAFSSSHQSKPPLDFQANSTYQTPTDTKGLTLEDLNSEEVEEGL